MPAPRPEAQSSADRSKVAPIPCWRNSDRTATLFTWSSPAISRETIKPANSFSGRGALSAGAVLATNMINIVPGYGHLDVFLGRKAAQDTYPVILEELAK